MSYATTANRPNPVAAIGALGVPGAFAAILVVGLAVTVVPSPVVPNPTGVTIKIDPPELPDDPVEPDTRTSTQQPTTQQPEFTVTRPDTPFEFDMGPTAPVGDLPPLGDLIGDIGPVDTGPPLSPLPPMFDPVAAAPRGNPGGWITDNDYRTSWITRGYSGVASFSLRVDSSGRVSSCTITRSTGHAALDDATCRLLERRARFDPARDTSGKAVAGSFSSSVNWKIPE